MNKNSIVFKCDIMTDIQIKLVDNIKACYYAGETLQGIVKLRTEQPLKVRGMTFILQVKFTVTITPT